MTAQQIAEQFSRIEAEARMAATAALRGIELSAAEALDVATKAALRAFGSVPACPIELTVARIPKEDY